MGWHVFQAPFPHLSSEEPREGSPFAAAKGEMAADAFHEQFKFLDEVSVESRQSPAIPAGRVKEMLQKHVLFHPVGENSAGLITIDDRETGISQATWLYVKSALDYYKKKRPAFIILRLNTPGGEVFSAQKISDALKEMDTQNNIPIVAFIDNWAISAGAMLAYSCRFITIVKDASMGAAEPITVDAGKMETASEKVNSALRADFANRAAFFGRNPLLAEAMVDKDTILVLRDGKIVKLDSEDQIQKKTPEPDVIISPKGKLLTLTSEQLMEYGVADILLQPRSLTPITDQEKALGSWPASKTLLFTDPFFEGIPHCIVDEYQMDWKTRFFVFLAHPVVSSILFLGLIVGAYVEMSSPGLGLAGTVALTCLILIILSSFSLEIAGWLEVILLLTGLIIILAELFLLPTFGLLGFVGILFFLGGLLGMMLPGAGSISFEFDTHTFNAAGEAFFERLAWLCGTLVLSFFLILLLSRYMMPALASFSRFVLSGHEQEGFIAVDNPSDLPQPGKVGEVLAGLRPAGKVMIDERIYDAISTGSFIEKGERIKVVRFEGSSIVVKRAEGEG